MPNWTGRPPYDPRDLLKLYVYGYFNKLRSSRKLLTECSRNIELFFLLNRLTPDFRTISDFRKDNAETLKKKLARIDENISKFLSQMDEEDSNQQSDRKYTSEEIKAAIEELSTRA